MLKKSLLSCFIILVCGSFVEAIPTVGGPSGLIEMPVAESVEYRKFEFGIDYQVSGQKDGDQGAHSYKFNLGTFKNFELGFVGGTVPTEGVFINAKYYLMSDDERFPVTIAVGLEKLGSHHDTSAYLVSSKRFDGGVNAHFGFEATFRETVNASAMLGMEYMIDERFSLLADVTGEKKDYSLNLGMRYYFEEDIVLRLYIIDFNKAESDDMQVLFGISFARFI
tara:strand:- start:1944 stop:2612 length:669 start_codon:yes stop_codon:yes gene_type:complete